MKSRALAICNFTSFVTLLLLLYAWDNGGHFWGTHQLISTSFSSSELHVALILQNCFVTLDFVASCMYAFWQCIVYCLHAWSNCSFSFTMYLFVRHHLWCYNNLIFAYDLNRTCHGMDITYTIFQIKIQHLIIYKLFILQ